MSTRGGPQILCATGLGLLRGIRDDRNLGEALSKRECIYEGENINSMIYASISGTNDVCACWYLCLYAGLKTNGSIILF